MLHIDDVTLPNRTNVHSYQRSFGLTFIRTIMCETEQCIVQSNENPRGRFFKFYFLILARNSTTVHLINLYSSIEHILQTCSRKEQKLKVSACPSRGVRPLQPSRSVRPRDCLNLTSLKYYKNKQLAYSSDMTNIAVGQKVSSEEAE